MAIETKSTIDACSSARDLKVARCKQFNDLLDKIMNHVGFHAGGVEVARGVDDIAYATSTLHQLIESGISMAVKFGYFEANDAD